MLRGCHAGKFFGDADVAKSSEDINRRVAWSSVLYLNDACLEHQIARPHSFQKGKQHLQSTIKYRIERRSSIEKTVSPKALIVSSIIQN